MSFKNIALPILVLSVLLLSACGGVPTLPAVSPSNTPASTETQGIASVPTQAPPTATSVPPTSTSVPPTATTAPPTATPTLSPTVTPTLSPVVPTDPAAANYIDDRSTPSQVVVSYFNAINRREYARAYGYYTSPSSTLGSFSAFQNGYASTTSVSLVFGSITSDVGAGQTYFSTPVILKALSSSNVQTHYAACYIVHQANPSFFGGPNFTPMGIDQGQAKVMPSGQSEADALAGACTGLPIGGNAASVGAETLDISQSNFIDNRSGPIETLSSFFNALNLQQYSRGYFYFDDPQTFPGNFDTWSAGYANTQSVTVVFGVVKSEGAAGSTYYSVPVGITAITTANLTQKFVGCYTLRLANPGVQAAPPFHPLGIVSGKLSQVDNNADVSALLANACP